MLKKLISLVVIISLFLSCRKESNILIAENNLVEDAKTWTEEFLLKNQINPIFQNIQYHWKLASTIKFTNGYNAISIPISEIGQNPDYKGIRLLYLYPWKNGKGYYSTIFEIIPKSDASLKKTFDLKKFNGIISSWDFKTGFTNGVQFSDGVALNNISLEYTEKNKSLISSFSQEKRVSSLSLPEVTVTGYIPAPQTGLYIMTLINSLGYGISYPWGLSNISNPCEYTNCSSTDPYDYFDEWQLNDINQKLNNKMWNQEKVKDSTNDPCIADAIDKIANINNCIPSMIKDFFGADPSFTMNIKNENVGPDANGYPPRGGSTSFNTNSSNFNVFINTYYDEKTDLSIAGTLIHEAMHCQLMNWFREASLNGNTQMQEYLANEYGYLFSTQISGISNNLADIVNGLNPTQHQEIATRFNTIIATTLYDFAINKGLNNVTFSDCKDLAWAGTFGSKAWNQLSQSDQTRILNKVNAEKDPTGAKNLNNANVTAKGNRCK